MKNSGWSKYYDFSDTDFSTSVKLVEDLWHNQTPQIQWKFISGLCSDAVYGGRIENVDDLKIVESYTKQYFTDEVLSHRWRPFGLKVNLPTAVKFEEYLSVIKLLPNSDMPSVFGLSENINRAWERQTSTRIITELKNLYLSKNTSKKFDQELFQKRLAPFMTLWKKINHGYDFIRMTNPPSEVKNSAVEMFIHEEFTNALKLLQTIHKCFATLNKVCKGLVTAEEEDLNIGYSLLNYKTPKLWLDFWKGPNDPNQYLRTVVNKAVNLSKWKNKSMQELMKEPMNMSCLFYPEALLASHKQDFSRAIDISIDELTLVTSWKPTNQSLVLTELLIEGGLFENGTLKPCTPDSENINNAPNCYLNWVDKKHFLEEDNSISIPLYTTSYREKQVTLLQVSCDSKEKDKWIQAGIAFYLEY